MDLFTHCTDCLQPFGKYHPGRQYAWIHDSCFAKMDIEARTKMLAIMAPAFAAIEAGKISAQKLCLNPINDDVHVLRSLENQVRAVGQLVIAVNALVTATEKNTKSHEKEITNLRDIADALREAIRWWMRTGDDIASTETGKPPSLLDNPEVIDPSDYWKHGISDDE